MTAAHYARLVALFAAAERREEATLCLPGGVRGSVTRSGSIELRPGISPGKNAR